jgi:fibronectin-binding autotransporter adhesin
MKYRQNPLRRPASLAATVITLGTTGILFLDSAQAQNTRTWDGDAGDSLLNSPNNWSSNALPVSGDTARWNGTVAGNLMLDYTTAFVNSGDGVSIDITSAQTGSLTIGSSTGVSMAIRNITIADGAGAFTLGDSTGVDSFGFRGASHTFTNNDNDTATFAAGISFFTGLGNDRTLNFTGNWAVNSALSTTTGAISVTKQDAGTLTLSGANAYRGVTTISGGTLSVSSIANGGVTGPTITTTSGATTATVSSTAGLAIGQTVVSQRITNGTTITGIDTGTNTITLSTAASGTAGTNVSSTIGTGNGLGLSTNAATNLVFDGGTLQYTGSTAISDRAFTINAGKTATIEVTTAGQSLTLVGATGTATDGALTKTGAGTLTLSGNSTYTGATTVSAGTLLLNGQLGTDVTPTGLVTVGANGTLGGTGALFGNLSFDADSMMLVNPLDCGSLLPLWGQQPAAAPSPPHLGIFFSRCTSHTPPPDSRLSRRKRQQAARSPSNRPIAARGSRLHAVQVTARSPLQG